ncbi:MAG TPA: FAD-dependent oxidoreductase, partial [Solirubrobacteraceae bacterium]|nr:FAD-dependent oxidoreductase [Solirubrobacteraceae bacterium]
MSERWDVIVVGAGICGLGAAYELARRDARVLVLERAGVGADQSTGLGRIFRIAHREARLCALALEARTLWDAWTEQLGAGRLLGDEGFVVSGPDVLTERAAAMREAGAEAREIDGAEL